MTEQTMTVYGVHVRAPAEPATEAAIAAILTAMPMASVDDAVDMIFALGCSHINTMPAVLLPLLLKYVGKTAGIEVPQ